MFKVGEKVICIDDTNINGYLVKGQVYTIDSIISKPVSYGKTIYFVTINERQKNEEFFSDRFDNLRKYKLERVLKLK